MRISDWSSDVCSSDLVLIALEDVENALAAVQSARLRRTQLAVAYDAANNAAILARSQYRAGLTDFQTLLTAERTLLSAQDGLASAGAERASALIQLYRARPEKRSLGEERLNWCRSTSSPFFSKQKNKTS